MVTMPGLDQITLDPSNQATELVSIARKRFELFRSDDGREWAVEKDGPNIAIQLGPKGKFAKRLARHYITENGKAPGSDAIGGAAQIIGAFLEDEDPRPVFLRVARHESGLVLDLGRADGNCVIIGPGQWHTEDRSPVPFRRGKTAPLPIPVRGEGGLAKLRKLWNLTDDGFRLAVACLVSYMIPGISYVILVARGEHGTAKTTFAKLFIRCIDPGRDPGRLSKDERNFGVKMWNGHVHVFDNLSSLAEWESNMLCRAVTGDDSGERTLYSDDELTSMPYQRPLVITTIDLGAVRPDLADRELPVDLLKIDENARKTERDEFATDEHPGEPGVLDEFDSIHAAVLGDLLDLLAAVVKNWPKVGKRKLPRMASFAKVLAALDLSYTEAHGKAHERPLFDLYTRIAKTAVAESARDDIVGAAILDFMLDREEQEGTNEWEGTTAQLFGALSARLPNPEKPPRAWPAKPESLGHKLPTLATSLRVNGWEVIRGKHSDRGRLIYIGPASPSPKVGEKPSEPSEPSDTHSDQRELPDGSPDGSACPDGSPDRAGQNRQALSPGNPDGSDGLTVFPGPSDRDAPWPPAETGPCAGCGTPCHRYGSGARSLCATCQDRRSHTPNPADVARKIQRRNQS